MGKIVVSEFVSIDGVMEAPGGEPGYKHTGWVGRFPDEGQFAYKFEEVMQHDALLVGRVTYESFAGAWPTYEGEFADRMNSMPKFVVSNSLQSADWNNTTILRGDAIEAVTKLKAEFDGTLGVGGSHTLVQALKEHDLIDEYRLMIVPIVLGSGFRLFENAEDALTLRVTDVRQFGSIVNLTYEPVRESSSEPADIDAQREWQAKKVRDTSERR
jgi:dihydrofolate reductase